MREVLLWIIDRIEKYAFLRGSNNEAIRVKADKDTKIFIRLIKCSVQVQEIAPIK